MALPTLQRKLFENDGYGPNIKDERLSTDITVKDWDASHDYPANVLAKAGGDIYRSVAASGPGTSAGAVNPAQDAGAYWENFSNVVHKTGDETVGGEKTFTDTLVLPGMYDGIGTFSIKNTTDDKDLVIIGGNDETNQGAKILLRGPSVADDDLKGTILFQARADSTTYRYLELFPSGEIVTIFSGFYRKLGQTRGTTTYPTVLIGNLYGIVDSNKTVVSALGTYQASNGDSYVELLVPAEGFSSSNMGNKGVGLLITATGTSLAFRPFSDNDIRLGNSGRRWSAVYAATSAIQTSDERLKSNVEPISNDVLDAWENLNFVQFQFTDSLKEKGNSARLHSGLIAQEIDRVFSSKNLDASRYGLFCYDEWKEEPEVRDENGKLIHPSTPAGDSYSLRYEEVLCVEAAYQRRRADRAEARIASLEARLAALEAKLNG